MHKMANTEKIKLFSSPTDIKYDYMYIKIYMRQIVTKYTSSF